MHDNQVFYHGAGSQVMLTKTSSPARGIMNDMAKSLLSPSEISTFDYYINQYETGYISIEDFTTALLQLLGTNEKVSPLLAWHDVWLLIGFSFLLFVCVCIVIVRSPPFFTQISYQDPTNCRSAQFCPATRP